MILDMSCNAIYLLPSPHGGGGGDTGLQILPPKRLPPSSLTWFLPFPAFNGQFIQMLMVGHINNINSF
jgi:hypothetical protein